jgi:predicted nucleic acid-binding protein
VSFVDSNVLIAVANADDALHGKSIELDLTAALTNQLAFAEVANVLQNRVKDKQRVLQVLSQITNNMNIIALSQADMDESLSVYEQNYPKLSFTDSSLLVQAKSMGQGLLTFDDKLVKAFNRLV